ncbi:hypothetical protein EDD86DRAFT_274147 [Gorgonomyces haynaldii]|nr:hypothetical protein EDD86DRAFT_274147 [Gorgonomyces haynaldii]
MSLTTRISQALSELSLNEPQFMITNKQKRQSKTDLFGNQQTVDLIVDNLARTFQVQRSHLGIVNRIILIGVSTNARSVLVGKGYPDIATRQLLILLESHLDNWQEEKTLMQSFQVTETVLDPQSIESVTLWSDIETVLCMDDPRCIETDLQSLETMPSGDAEMMSFDTQKVKEVASPIKQQFQQGMWCLTDSDPWGIDIYLTYSLGAADRQHLSIKSLKWLGIKPSTIPKSENTRLNLRDYNKGLSLLTKDLPKSVKRELQIMVHQGYKFELPDSPEEWLKQFARHAIHR